MFSLTMVPRKISSAPCYLTFRCKDHHTVKPFDKSSSSRRNNLEKNFWEKWKKAEWKSQKIEGMLSKSLSDAHNSLC